MSQSKDIKNSIAESKIQKKDSLTKPVAEIARQVTVRIFTEPGSGSGVVIARHHQTYTVLTCQHVIANSKNGKYSVLSTDGKIHQARLKPVRKLQGFDLALVQFESKNLYPVVQLGNSQILTAESPVFSAGFPNYHLISQDAIEETSQWGTKAFRLTTGKVMMLLTDKSLPEGYRLGYTNEVDVGMSGGPVLNEKGELVGINGRLKYPIQGISVFTFADGSKPPQEMFEQMETLSWAVPIAIFRQLGEDAANAGK
ncbi:MAG: serine protease [Goleter apudmare HA4340-LM2]|jgi:S1-C subfamily serine protease|nr:serine protease [Goleter apudmare HA4340-LM2]